MSNLITKKELNKDIKIEKKAKHSLLFGRSFTFALYIADSIYTLLLLHGMCLTILYIYIYIQLRGNDLKNLILTQSRLD